jgi:hypothetical protein
MATSTFPFCVTEHVIDGQYIREYPRATIPQATSLKLVIKKYTPIDYQEPQPGDVTLVAASGCGFPKVKPLFLQCTVILVLGLINVVCRSCMNRSG